MGIKREINIGKQMILEDIISTINGKNIKNNSINPRALKDLRSMATTEMVAKEEKEIWKARKEDTKTKIITILMEATTPTIIIIIIEMDQRKVNSKDQINIKRVIMILKMNK